MSIGQVIPALALAATVPWVASCRPSAPEERPPTLPQPAAALDTPQGVRANAAPAATAPPSSAESIIASAAAIERSGRIALETGREMVVDPAARFEIELSARSADARLVLLDGRDALVAGTSAREMSQASTRLTLSPSTPLTPGSRYVLRVDGAVTRELHDASGRAYEPAGHPLLVAGTPPPPEPKKKPQRRRRRR